jgi:putative SOS response-associated peptidase YedK
MCGKFTAMASWADITAFAEATPEQYSDLSNDQTNDRAITLRVMSILPIIVWDRAQQKRRVVPMRWGFPHPGNPNVPQPIHARAETIDTTPAFADAFALGQRGIVLVRNFNEGRELENGKTEQHTIALGDTAAAGIAFLYRRFDLGGRNPNLGPLLNACVMATVPANRLIAALPTDRMPAVLVEADWATWLGEAPGSLADAKSCLKMVEGVNWTMTREERAAKQKRARPAVSDPQGLF